MMLLLRSLVFNVAFYVTLCGYCIVMIPTLLMPPGAAVAFAKHWGLTNLWLLRAIVGLRYEITGHENLPAGSYIAAVKHQSFWETFALLHLFDFPSYILKRELMWLPFFGWYLWASRMIPINRSDGPQALPKMLERAASEIATGRQILIYPEGTRRAPGAEPSYKFGVARLYGALNVPCVPIAQNAGLYWRRRSFLRYPGTVRVRILPPIPPGMDPQDFFTEVQKQIETATADLVAQGRQELIAAGYPDAAR